ncbi:MAG: 30S ribosomal protein S5, partial [Planctomycetota bacterium]
GIVAGATVRAVLEMAGYSDCITKSLGSGNKLNVVKATIDGLAKMRLLEEVAERRGVELEASVIEQRIERAKALTGAGIGASTEPAAADDEDDADPATDN